MYKNKIQELEQKLEHFERECNNHETVLNTTVQKNKTLIEKLQEEKAMQEVCIKLDITHNFDPNTSNI